MLSRHMKHARQIRRTSSGRISDASGRVGREHDMFLPPLGVSHGLSGIDIKEGAARKRNALDTGK